MLQILKRKYSSIVAGIIISLIFIFTGCNEKTTGLQDLEQDLLLLRLTEIHYHPLELDDEYTDDSLEFIEIKNTGSVVLDLSSLQFTSGIKYSFPSGTKLGPNEFYVISSSLNGFKKRYKFSPDDVYTGQLKNSGETITLADRASHSIIFSHTYSDSGAWPSSADGDGYSLVPVKTNPGKDDTGAVFWRSSRKLHGSPGADEEFKQFDTSLLKLRITEINYHPDYSDTAGEDSLEFIEIKNTGSKKINLTGVAFTSGVNYKFADGATIDPGAFIVLASSPSWFKKRYGFEPFDRFKGQLKNSSETITLEDVEAAVTIISITYKDDNPWPSKPDGEGWTLVPIHSNPSLEDQNNPAFWRASFKIHGSPGSDDPQVILINEVLTHTDEPQVDAIELYNPNNSDVNIGGWYLSDDQTEPAKFRIPDETIIKANGYYVFTANDFDKDQSPNSFGLSENGDNVVLSSDSTGCEGYCHSVSFGALERGVSYGRYIVASTGNEVFTTLSDVTLGAPNSDPLVGPLVISEIMFHSKQDASDYIEITNISTREVTLYDQKYPNNTWRLQIEDSFYSLPKGKTVKSGESVVVLCGSDTSDNLRAKLNIATGVQIFSINAALPDSSAKIELEKPMEPNKDASGNIISKIEYMEYDKVSYKSKTPWPVGANGTGSSLTRIDNTKYGNDPANWSVKEATPGRVE